LGAVFDPLDGPAQSQGSHRGQDVAGIDRHLAAEAAADVGGDDADQVLGQAGNQGKDRADGVGRLGGHVDGELAGGRLVLGHSATTAATSWPWNFTVSTGSTICLSDMRVGIQASPAASRSLPVMTASTPGSARAASALMLLIRA